MVALFILGSSLLLGISSHSKQDSWIAFLLSMTCFLPILYIYIRLMHLYPGLNLFEICLEVFGKIVGRIVVILYVLYALDLGALVLRNYSEFIQVRVFNQMPQSISLIAMILAVIYASKKGVEVLARWSAIALPIILFLVAVVTILLLKDMHLSYMLPIGENIQEVPQDAFDDFSFPMAETVLFLSLLNNLRKGDKPGKTCLIGLLIGGGVLLISLLRNFMTLGVALHEDKWFPSYAAASLIIAGNFLSRIENIVGANLILGGFVKISVCLLAASMGSAKLFNEDNYRPFVAPLGLMMAALAGILYNSIMEMYDFIDVYPYYASLFEIVFPILLCVTAETKMIIKSKKEHDNPPSPTPAEET